MLDVSGNCDPKPFFFPHSFSLGLMLIAAERVEASFYTMTLLISIFWTQLTNVDTVHVTSLIEKRILFLL